MLYIILICKGGILASYDYYKAFYFVGKYKSFSKAARALGNSQPNITRIINNLEAELNCKLFERSKKGVRLTADGEKLFFHVQIANRQIQLGEAELAAAVKEDRSSLAIGFSIGITDILIREYIVPVLHDFRVLYPSVQIHIVNDSTPRLIELANENKIDMAIITSYETTDDMLNETILYSFQDILIAGKAYESLSENTISLSELQKYPMIGLWKETETYQLYKGFFAANGLPYDPMVETGTTDQVLSFVLYDMGIGFVSPDYAKDALKKGKVFRISLAESLPMRHISLIYNVSKSADAEIKTLEEMLLGGFE